MHINPLADAQAELGEVVIAIGVFDGMHLGHRALFAMARQYAATIGVPVYALTFDRDPDEVFAADDASFGKLLENETRLAMIGEQVDGGVLSLPATLEVFAIPPYPFLDFLCSIAVPRAIYTGADFRFGAQASGTVEDIACWATKHDCECVPCELVEEGGAAVSATRVRKLLAAGDVAQARELLAHRAHSVTGRVVHGRGQGGDFGFATANLDLSECAVMLPKEGVYGAYAYVDERPYAAAVNVGAAKSFADATSPLEAHLLDFEGDLYGKQIRIEFMQWLREPRVFATNEELISTVMGNIDYVREHLAVPPAKRGCEHGANL